MVPDGGRVCAVRRLCLPVLLGVALAACGSSSSTTTVVTPKSFVACLSRSPILTILRHRGANGFELIFDTKQREVVIDARSLGSVRAAKQLFKRLPQNNGVSGQWGRFVYFTTTAISDADISIERRCLE